MKRSSFDDNPYVNGQDGIAPDVKSWYNIASLGVLILWDAENAMHHQLSLQAWASDCGVVQPGTWKHQGALLCTEMLILSYRLLLLLKFRMWAAVLAAEAEEICSEVSWGLPRPVVFKAARSQLTLLSLLLPNVPRLLILHVALAWTVLRRRVVMSAPCVLLPLNQDPNLVSIYRGAFP